MNADSYRKVYDVYSRSDGRFQVRATTALGKQRCFTCKTREAAEQKRLELEALLVQPMEAGTFRKWDGSLRWWEELLSDLAARVRETGDPGLRNDLAACARAATAAKVLHDYSDIEGKVDALQEALRLEGLSDVHGVGTYFRKDAVNGQVVRETKDAPQVDVVADAD